MVNQNSDAQPRGPADHGSLTGSLDASDQLARLRGRGCCHSNGCLALTKELSWVVSGVKHADFLGRWVF